jgi:GGDEF domain-containing protein
MSKKDSAQVRMLVFFLGGMLILAAFLVTQVNPLEFSLAILALLAGVAAVGLLTNIWGGLFASVIASFAVILLNQYMGIYPRENYILNISSELAVLLAVGPLAGAVSNRLEKMQHHLEHWVRIAEQHTIHDETFGTLKPEWAKIRLDEEVLRAVRFQRPLAIALLELESHILSQDERVAALQALIRVTRAAAQPPCVVSHIGSDQLLLVLPEHDPIQVQALLEKIKERVGTEKFFPDGAKTAAEGLGKPLGAETSLRAGLASLDGALTADAFINKAREALEG